MVATRLYPVEISGWDNTEDFFVEKCELEWNEQSGKQVALKRELNDSAVLLVRLLQSGDADRSHAVVYEASRVGQTESGLHQFRLDRMVPRQREEASSSGLAEEDRTDVRRSLGTGEKPAEFRTETTR
jgi:hypothetical protein